MPPVVPKTSQRPRVVACSQTWAAGMTPTRLLSIIEAPCGACRLTEQHRGIEICQWLQVKPPDARTVQRESSRRADRRCSGVMASQVDVMGACCLRSTKYTDQTINRDDGSGAKRRTTVEGKLARWSQAPVWTCTRMASSAEAGRDGPRQSS